MKIIVSNGNFRFHLPALAKELENKKLLKLFITGGYPTKIINFFYKKNNSPSYLRFLERRAENINSNLIFAINSSEIFIRFGAVILRNKSQKLEQKVSVFGMKWYSLIAALKLLFTKADIYHYRNCYGGISVKVAQWKGMVTICDHSIAHPYLAAFMTSSFGQYPNSTELKNVQSELLPLFKRMNSDFNNNDTIVVNSDFVKNTMIFCGYKSERIKVVYVGVDDAFLKEITHYKENNNKSNNAFLFAGGLQERKGIFELMKAVQRIPCFIELAGGADVEVINSTAYRTFSKLPFVKYHGVLPRRELASLMSNNRIFVFPSFCEGSARVIFEALACGLFVITTENSGSIVKHLENGYIMASGKQDDIAAALLWAFNIDNQILIDEIRFRNYNLIRNEYLQESYGNSMIKLYKNLLDN